MCKFFIFMENQTRRSALVEIIFSDLYWYFIFKVSNIETAITTGLKTQYLLKIRFISDR